MASVHDLPRRKRSSRFDVARGIAGRAGDPRRRLGALGELLGAEDGALAAAGDAITLQRLLRALPTREVIRQSILQLQATLAK